MEAFEKAASLDPQFGPASKAVERLNGLQDEYKGRARWERPAIKKQKSDALERWEAQVFKELYALDVEAQRRKDEPKKNRKVLDRLITSGVYIGSGFIPVYESDSDRREPSEDAQGTEAADGPQPEKGVVVVDGRFDSKFPYGSVTIEGQFVDQPKSGGIRIGGRFDEEPQKGSIEIEGQFEESEPEILLGPGRLVIEGRFDSQPQEGDIIIEGRFDSQPQEGDIIIEGRFDSQPQEGDIIIEGRFDSQPQEGDIIIEGRFDSRPQLGTVTINGRFQEK